MRANHLHGIAQLRIGGHFLGDRPFVDLIGGDDLHLFQTGLIERAAKKLDPLDIIGALVPNAAVAHIDVVIFFRAFDESHDQVGVVLRKESAIAHPARRAPLQHIEDNVRVPFFGLLHQPPLVAAVEIFRLGILKFLPRPGDARLGAVGGIYVSANLHLQMLQGRTEVRLEKKVENLAALRLGVIEKQPGGSPRAQRADAFECLSRL